MAHRDGYGFLVPDKPIPRVEGDIYIGRDGLGDAMHGDRVLARIEHRRADGRAEGRIVQVVEARTPDRCRIVSLRSARQMSCCLMTRVFIHEVYNSGRAMN